VYGSLPLLVVCCVVGAEERGRGLHGQPPTAIPHPRTYFI
jgi:hypothetical protein